MTYNKPEVLNWSNTLEAIQQSISAKPSSFHEDLNVGYTDVTTAGAYEADE